MDISKNIKAIREERKISQSEIARSLGVEPTNYPRMEKRGNKLTVEQLEKIAGALGVSVVELITGQAEKVQDNGQAKEAEKRVEELEEIINLLRQEKNRLSHYFFNELQAEIIHELQYYSIQRQDSLFNFIYDTSPKVEKIVKSVIIKQHYTEKKLAVFTPETACIFNFLLCHTSEDQEEFILGDRQEAYNTIVNTSNMQKTSEAILEYIRRERIKLKKLSKYEDYKDYYGDNYKALEKFAKQLSIEQENLLKTKRLLFTDLTIYGYYIELIFNTDGWKFAYEDIKQRLNVISMDGKLTRSIIHSGIVNDEEFVSVFYPSK